MMPMIMMSKGGWAGVSHYVDHHHYDGDDDDDCVDDADDNDDNDEQGRLGGSEPLPGSWTSQTWPPVPVLTYTIVHSQDQRK